MISESIPILQNSAIAAGLDQRLLSPIDFGRYHTVTFEVIIEGVTGTPTSGTFDLKLQRMDSLQQAWEDIATKAITQVAYNGSFPVVQRITVTSPTDFSNLLRYEIDAVLGGGSSPRFTTHVVAHCRGD